MHLKVRRILRLTPGYATKRNKNAVLKILAQLMLRAAFREATNREARRRAEGVAVSVGRGREGVTLDAVGGREEAEEEEEEDDEEDDETP